jgi:uncharacterized protein
MAKGGIVANLVVHVEIHASEPQRLIDFYAALFGWNFTQFGDMPYWAIDTGDVAIGMDTPGRGINGGLMQRKGPAPERGAPVNGCDFVVGVDGSSERFVKLADRLHPRRLTCLPLGPEGGQNRRRGPCRQAGR